MFQAIAAFRQAIDAAEKLGDDGYEALTQSLSMLSATAANSARYDEADEAMSRCLRIFEEHGDMIGLAVALQNRCVASYMTGNADRFVADMERIIHLAREFGFTVSECLAVRDLAEFYFALGRIDEAVPRARRALEMYQQELGPTSRLGYLAEVQLARMFAYQGDIAAAEEITRRIVAAQAAAKAEGRNELIFVEPERILLDGVDFFVRSETDAKFDALAERGRVLQLQPPDIVEIMEWTGLSALRAGRDAEGRRFLAEALAAAEGTMAFDRVSRRVASVAAEAAAPSMAGRAS